MQPRFRQVPPRVGRFSISATLSPSCAARNAHTYPPGPAPMTATSYVSMKGRRSDAQQEARGILDLLLHLDEEGDSLAAVDHAVVVGQGGEPRGRDDDLPAYGDRTLLDRMHPQDGALGRVDDRGRKEGAEGAPVRDREHAALKVGERDLCLAGPACRVGNGLFDVGQAEAVAAADDGDHQAALRRNGNADAIVVRSE